MDDFKLRQITPEIISAVEDEFKASVTAIFGDNLRFAFIFGGIAKGYAKDFSHDVDMFLCLKERNAQQKEEFRKFYFEVHERYGFKNDPIDPGEIVTLEQLRDSLDLLKRIKIRLAIESYQEYEAIVWGDLFAGKVSAQTGDLETLKSIQDECQAYPERWRRDILGAIDPDIYQREQEVLENLNITLLFERFVKYHKRKDVLPKIGVQPDEFTL